MTTLIIYRDDCWDAMTSAYLINRKLAAQTVVQDELSVTDSVNAFVSPQTVFTSAWSYDVKYITMPLTRAGGTSELLRDYDTIYVLAIAMVPQIVEQLAKLRTKKIIWIMNRADSAELTGELANLAEVEIIVQDAPSTAHIVWQHVSAVKPPFYLSLLAGYYRQLPVPSDECVKTFIISQQAAQSFSGIDKYFAIERHDDQYNSITRHMVTYGSYQLMETMAQSVIRNDSAKYKRWRTSAGEFMVVKISAIDATGIILQHQLRKYMAMCHNGMSTYLDFVVHVRTVGKVNKYTVFAAREPNDAHQLARQFGGGGDRWRASFTLSIHDTTDL